MKTPFKQQVKNLVTTPSLSDEQMQSLKNILVNEANSASHDHSHIQEEPGSKTRLARLKINTYWAKGFGVGVAASLAIYTCLLIFAVKAPLDIGQEIANEVAVNHIKLKPMEVTGKNFAQVKDYFSLLDFSPIQSQHIGLGQKKLVGGRYCSIKAIPAAQLRYEDNKGGLFTVYQTDYDSHIFSQLAENTGENIIIRYAKGLRVEIWREQGLVLASVRKEAQ